MNRKNKIGPLFTALYCRLFQSRTGGKNGKVMSITTSKGPAATLLRKMVYWTTNFTLMTVTQAVISTVLCFSG